MKFTKNVLIVLGFLAIPFVFIQQANTFTLQIDGQYFDDTNILTGNRGEVRFTDGNIGYGAFFLGSGINTNTTLKIGDNWTINCKKQLNGYYTILFTNFLMLGIDSYTASRAQSSGLTPDTIFKGAGLYYDCTARSPNTLNINQNLKGVYGRIGWEYGSGESINTGSIWAGIEKDNNTWKRSDTSALELVLSTSTGYISKTLSGNFVGSLAYYIPSSSSVLPRDPALLWLPRILYTGYVIPRDIGDIRINNADKIESGVYVIPYENYQNPGIDISIVTAKPNTSTNIVMTGQYQKHNSQTGVFPSPRYLTSLSTTVSSITVPSGHFPENDVVFTGAYGYYGYKNIKFKHSDYRHLSGTLTLNIGNWSRSINFRVEGGEPCLSGRDNDYFITPDFWKLNEEKGGPTKAQIKCAIFGYADTRYNESNGAGYRTAYTTGWLNYGENTCTSIKVVMTGGLPNTLDSNTIYVLTSTGVNLSNNNRSIPRCTAIISKANAKNGEFNPTDINLYYGRDTTLDKTITINGDNVVLDNISIKGNSFNTNGITISNKKNVTMNVVKVYNNNIGIYLNKASNIILNNIQSFNNNVGIQLTDSSYNTINNSQIYRNTKGVELNRANNGSQNNIIYNSAIYQNNEGLRIIGTNSNNNRFDNIDIYENKENGHDYNIYIEKGLNNIGNNIKIQNGNDITVNIQEKIDGFNRIEYNLEQYTPYEYTCIGGTIGRCLLRTETSQIKYYCTGAINPNYEEAKKDFTADGIHQNENLRTLSIEGENYANFDTYIYDESGAGTHLQFSGNIQLNRNVDTYEFNGLNISGTLTPLINSIEINGTTYSYEVKVIYNGRTFTGYGNEKTNYHVIEGTGDSVPEIGNLLCEHDGGLSGNMRQLSALTNPPVNISNDTPTITNIFSNNPTPNEFICNWANCFTNPKLSNGSYSYLIPWNTYYYGKTGIINITDYSYGIDQKRQEDILLPGGVAGGKIKYNGYFGGYFIGSNVPAQSIGRNKMNVISKINYEIGGSTNNSHGGNKFNIISFIERFPIGPLSTIVSYNEGAWNSLPNRTRQQTRSNKTNIYTGLNNGSSTVLFLEPGDTTHYPVILQVYGNKYFATHRWMTRLGRENLYFDIQSNNLRCLPPNTNTITITGQWLTHENEGIAFNYEHHPLIGANVTGITQDIIKIDGNGSISNFNIINNKTGAVKRDLNIPCTTGNSCSVNISIRYPNQIEDILKFKSNNRNIKYQRDMEGPNIMISSTGAIECRDTTIRIKLDDDCIGTSGFMISGFYNTGWLSLETVNGRNKDRYDIIIDSGSVGRTGKDENGQMFHKTGIIYTKDKYNNETTGLIDIQVIDTPITMLPTGSTISTALDILDGERIEEHNRSTGVDIVELYGVTEGEYCKTQDLSLTGFKCFNYESSTELGSENRALTGNISGHILTISPRQETDYYTYQSGIICRINVKDNENNTVTGYMIFNINTVHKPHLSEEPVIIGGTKYSEYSGAEYLDHTYANGIYENINTGKNNNYENQKYLSGDYSKYTSGDIVYIYLGNINKYVKMYHVSCTEYYTGTNTTYRNTIPENKIIEFNGIENIENCGTGQIKGLYVSVWNGGEGGNNEIFGNNIDQFATGITDYIFYDYIPANTSNVTNNNKNKIIITSGHTIEEQIIRVRDPEGNTIDTRPNVIGYTNNSIILNTGILNLVLTGGLTLNTKMFAKIRPGTTETRSKNASITGTIISDTIEHVHEKQIYIDIGTGLLRDFAKVGAKPNYTGTRYRYTSKNPIYVEGGKRGKPNTPEHDISILRVKIDSGVIDTGLHFQLLTAKPINNINDIECTGYSNIGRFRCTNLSGESRKVSDIDEVICTSRDTSGINPKCNDWAPSFDGYGYNLVGNYPGDEHRIAKFSRLNTISYEIYSGEENSGYYNQHTGEWEFFGKVGIKNTDKRFNYSYIIIKLFENKTPFKEGVEGSEGYWYGDLGTALDKGSGDNGFLFYISRPQKINTGNINSGVIGDISYEINFSEPVADEFYYITGESIVNKFKKTLFIKRPTYNFANPKGYLFNFPDYDGFTP